MSIRRLKVVEGRLQDLHIERLTIGELHIRSRHAAAADGEPLA
jgi:hypothetical protein